MNENLNESINNDQNPNESMNDDQNPNESMDNDQDPNGSINENGIPVQAEAAPQRPRFLASTKEKLLAFAMYAIAYLYVIGFCAVDTDGMLVILSIFTVLFIAMVEYMFYGQKRPWESWIWFAGLVACWAGMAFDVTVLGGVFDVWEKSYLLHAFAVYWALVRSGRMSEKNSSHLLPLDLVNAFCIVPFKRFILRARVVIATFTEYFSRNRTENGEKKKKNLTWLWVVLALVIGVSLLCIAVKQLAAADDRFEAMVHDLFAVFENIKIGEYIGYLFLSLPVGAYLYGLIAGLGRETVEQVEHRGAMFMKGIGFLRRIPSVVWSILILLFSAVYAVFFFLQAQYLFGAFTGSLPEGFIVSEYARQGFFEMCKVMAVNFVLVWLSLRTSASEDETAGKQTLRVITECVLLLESMLFAVIAFSKLALYMSIFGFTPLRLQSTWLVTVLFFGCIAMLTHLLSGKKTALCWIIYSGVSLAALCLL